LRQFVVLLTFGFDLLRLLAQRLDLKSEPPVLVGEGVLADLVGVVKIEQLAPFLLGCAKR
jgi:hypothetical protein